MPAKKNWQKPAVDAVELVRAQELIEEAIRLIGPDAPESAELRSIVEAIQSLRKD